MIIYQISRITDQDPCLLFICERCRRRDCSPLLVPPSPNWGAAWIAPLLTTCSSSTKTWGTTQSSRRWSRRQPLLTSSYHRNSAWPQCQWSSLTGQAPSQQPGGSCKSLSQMRPSVSARPPPHHRAPPLSHSPPAPRVPQAQPCPQWRPSSTWTTSTRSPVSQNSVRWQSLKSVSELCKVAESEEWVGDSDQSPLTSVNYLCQSPVWLTVSQNSVGGQSLRSVSELCGMAAVWLSVC